MRLYKVDSFEFVGSKYNLSIEESVIRTFTFKLHTKSGDLILAFNSRITSKSSDILERLGKQLLSDLESMDHLLEYYGDRLGDSPIKLLELVMNCDDTQLRDRYLNNTRDYLEGLLLGVK